MPAPMSEKKWFIYVGDHHEGPFTVAEIWSGIEAGTFLQTAFVWADGMKEWAPLKETPDFNEFPIAASIPKVAEPIAPITLQATADDASQNSIPPIEEPSMVMELELGPSASSTSASSNWDVESSPSFEVRPTVAAEPVSTEPTRTGVTTVVEVKAMEDATRAEMLRPAAIAREEFDQGPGFFKRLLKPLAFIAGILVCFILLQKTGMLRGVEERVIGIFSTLPQLPDVSPEDYEELKNAVRAPTSGGPQLAISLSKADPLSPIFYIATNLPDGAKFEIYVEGVGHRILNTLSFSGKLDVTTLQHYARSQPLRYPDGKPIPRGEYVIYVMEAPANQPDLVYKELLQLAPIARNLPNHLPQERRLVFSKKIFFGAKDSSYEQRLKEFHDGLLAKAKGEVFELSQAVATLESQALVSISTYDRLKSQPIGPKQKQAWNEINRTWRPVESQLVQKYAGLSPEQVKENYFHGNLIAEFIVVEKILSDLHSTQEKLFTTSANANNLQGEIADLRKQFENRKEGWKSAIERAQNAPASPETGLPVNISLDSPTAPAAESPPEQGNAPESGATKTTPSGAPEND